MRHGSACIRVLFLLIVFTWPGVGVRPAPPAAHAQAVVRVAGLWAGTWQSQKSPQFGSLSLKLQQTGGAFTGTVTMTNAVMCGADQNVIGQIASGSMGPGPSPTEMTTTTGNVPVGHCSIQFNGKIIWQPSGVLWTGTYTASGPSGTLDEGTFGITTVGTTTF